MAAPVGITLGNYDVIIEVSDGDSVNIFASKNFGGGYARQLGTLVTSCDEDDFVQYNKTGSVDFIQDGVTYSLVKDSAILFVQTTPP